jgi:hypothetical protein
MLKLIYNIVNITLNRTSKHVQSRREKEEKRKQENGQPISAHTEAEEGLHQA